MKGKFITFEGCEGVGKTTQVRLLKEYCADNSVDAVFTREPGGTPISEQIRDIIMDNANGDMDPVCELMLYAAARRQHTVRIILPAINNGKTVFCDRYIDSTMAYQGYARGVDKSTVSALNDYAMGGMRPDYTVFIDVDPEKGFARKGGAAGDRLESENLDFHKRVYDGFRHIFAEQSDRALIIDASGTKYETHGKIIDALKQKGVL